MRVRSIAGGVEVLAPAKLNLFLEVLGRRPDGYHEIETVMVAISLCDTLTFRDDPSGAIRLRCSDPALPVGADNLVIKAADRLREATGCRRGAEIDLTKVIPAQAGLAGGSSDAAATLAALDRLWDLRLAPERLDALAAEVGSDVPFFNHVPAAVCRGRGERVEPVSLMQTLQFCSGLSARRGEHGRRLPRCRAARSAEGCRAGPGCPRARRTGSIWGGACSIGSNPSPRPCGPNSFGSGMPWRTWARRSTGPR